MTAEGHSFQSFADHVETAFGCRSVTVLLHHAEDAERIYSSDPAFVPATGRKRFDEAPAMAQLRANARPQKFEGLDSIRRMFRDWEKLEAAGLLCLVNIPLIDGDGRLQGQVNLVLPEGRLTEADLDDLCRRADALTPQLLSARRAADGMGAT